jgi:hypothetical protein
MQAAARRVARENSQLRILLASHGVGSEDITRFIHDREGYFLSNPATGPLNTAHQDCIDVPEGSVQIGSVELELNTSTPNSAQTLPNFRSICGPRHDRVLSPGIPNDSRDRLFLEMSCETAASIIASMRGNVDHEQVRLQLGCGGREQCIVKNTEVFQVLDQD